MPRVLLSPRYSADSVAIWQAALAIGWSTARVEHAEAHALLGAVEADEVVVYGETLLADAVAAALGLALFEAPAAWLPALPEELRLRDIALCTLGEARRIGAGKFIKPVDDKFFPARVYAAVDVDDVGEDLEVFVAEPVRFGVEVRVIAAVDLPPAIVIDVGEIAGRGWAVVEANPAWASGICGVDPRVVLPVLRRACVPATRVAAEEFRWVRPRLACSLPRAAW